MSELLEVRIEMKEVSHWLYVCFICLWILPSYFFLNPCCLEVSIFLAQCLPVMILPSHYMSKSKEADWSWTKASEAVSQHSPSLPGASYARYFVIVMQGTNPMLNFLVRTPSKSLIFALWSHLRNRQTGACLHFYWEERCITNWKILIFIPFISWNLLETSKLIVL